MLPKKKIIVYLRKIHYLGAVEISHILLFLGSSYLAFIDTSAVLSVFLFFILPSR